MDYVSTFAVNTIDIRKLKNLENNVINKMIMGSYFALPQEV